MSANDSAAMAPMAVVCILDRHKGSAFPRLCGALVDQDIV